MHLPGAGSPDTGRGIAWRDAPGVLEALVVELFEAQPQDVLKWLHEAAWRLNAEHLGGHTVSLDDPLRLAGPPPAPLSLDKPSPRQVSPQPHAQQHVSFVTVPSEHADVVQPQIPERRRKSEVALLEIFSDPDSQTVSEGAAAPARAIEPVEAELEAAVPHSGGAEVQPLARQGMMSSGGSVLSSNSGCIEDMRSSISGCGSGKSYATSHKLCRGDSMHFTVHAAAQGVLSLSTSDSANRFADTQTGKPRIDPGVLLPLGRFRVSWDVLFFICLLYDMFLTPVELGLGVQDTGVFLTVAPICVLVVFTFDIFLNFNTGYYKRERLIMSRRSIGKNYLTGWFCLDALATVPDLIVVASYSSQVAGDQISSVRAFRALKMYKTLKGLKLIRSARLLRSQATTSMAMKQLNISTGTMFAIQLAQGHVLLLLLVHFNAVLWAAWHPEWRLDDGIPMSTAMVRYQESLCRMYRTLTFGDDMPVGNTEQEVLSVLVSLQRGTLLIVAAAWLQWRMLVSAAATAKQSVSHESALGYLRHHHVSSAMQLKVLQTLKDTSALRRQQEEFHKVASLAFPPQLKQSVANELWSQRLMTLDLILEVTNWRPTFVRELAMAVYEEVVPSKVVVYSIGDASDAAYLILRGTLAVTVYKSEEKVPDFTPGMWVGEKALVNPRLPRVKTIVCTMLCQLMVVPSEAFQKLLAQNELKDKFARLLNERLWLGICGRCGMLGDHYGGDCHTILQDKPRIFISASNPTRHSNMMKSRSGTRRFADWVVESALGHRKSDIGFADSSSAQCSNKDLTRFLELHGLAHLFEHMGRHGISKLSDLKLASVESLKADPAVQLTQEEARILSESAVKAFTRKMMNNTNRLLGQHEEKAHLIFISHYKVEAGSTAALMQEAIARILEDDPLSIAKDMEAPVFLDTEDLRDLNDLKRHVLLSHNIVFLLTRGVLTRPWCLLELVTAIRSGAYILPVLVEEPSTAFEFPDEAYYERLRAGQALDEACAKFLASEGVDLLELEQTLRQVFRRIALPFSPHKTAKVRRAELGDLLKECRLRRRVLHGGEESSAGRSIEDAEVPYGSRRTIKSATTRLKSRSMSKQMVTL